MSPQQFQAAQSALGLNNRELAALLAVSPCTVSLLRGGKQPINRRTEMAMRWLHWRRLGRYLED